MLQVCFYSLGLSFASGMSLIVTGLNSSVLRCSSSFLCEILPFLYHEDTLVFLYWLAVLFLTCLEHPKMISGLHAICLLLSFHGPLGATPPASKEGNRPA